MGPICCCCHGYCRVPGGPGTREGKPLGFGSLFVRIRDPFPAPEAGLAGFAWSSAVCTEAHVWASGCELAQAGVLARGDGRLATTWVVFPVWSSSLSHLLQFTFPGRPVSALFTLPGFIATFGG